MNPLQDQNSPDTGSEQWLHDLRNAVNALGLSLAVVQRCVEQDQSQRALEFLQRAHEAAERCRKLLQSRGPPAPM